MDKSENEEVTKQSIRSTTRKSAMNKYPNQKGQAMMSSKQYSIEHQANFVNPLLIQQIKNPSTVSQNEQESVKTRNENAVKSQKEKDMVAASEEQKEKEVPVKTVTVVEKVSKGDSKNVEKV